MTSPRDERTALEGEEREFVERLAAEYAPSPMSAAGRLAFDQAIRARLERPRRSVVLIPAVGAAAAAALIWFAIGGTSGPLAPQGEETGGTVVASTWEDELFLSSELSAQEDRDEGEALPEDYLAIASLLLGG